MIIMLTSLSAANMAEAELVVYINEANEYVVARTIGEKQETVGTTTMFDIALSLHSFAARDFLERNA